MRKIIIGVLGFIMLGYAATLSAAAPKAGGKHVQLMFVQTAKAVTFDGNQMTLKEISPSTIFFSDRPERITGHLTLPAFLKEWDAGKDSFAKDPPNATLSIFSEDKVDYVVVELLNPKQNGDDLTYEVKILQGNPPAKGGIASLFIDWYSYYYPDACHRNYYTGAAYCYHPGWSYYPGYRYYRW